jgi:hypothetical protein
MDVTFVGGVCDVICAGTPEGETNCGQPSDTTNGGCNSNPNVFSTAVSGTTYCGTGFYDGATRDTDWWELTIPAGRVVTQTIEAEFQVVIGLINDNAPFQPTLPMDCDNPNLAISPFAVLGPCTPGSITTVCLTGPATYWFFVGADFNGQPFTCGGVPPAGDQYEMTITANIPPIGACCLPDGTCMDGVTLCDCESSPLLGRFQGNGVLCSGVSCPVSGCVNDTLVTCNSTTGVTLTLNTGLSLPLMTCATGPDSGNNPKWFSFVATGNSAEVQTCNSAVGMDSVLTAYSGTCPGGLTELACSDDICGASGFNSRLCFSTIPNDTYYVQVAAWDNTPASQGLYDLEVNCPCPDLEPQACCDDLTGTCTDVTPDMCTGPTQRLGGVGTTCATVVWTPACGSGACCSALAGGCVPDQTQTDCFAIFQGTDWFPGQICAPDPCIGACCLPNGSCQTTTEANCTNLGGINFYQSLDCTGPAPPVCNLPNTCIWDNGGRLDDFGAAAAQVAPDFPFVAEAADDFTLKGTSTNDCLITEITAYFSYFNLAARPNPAVQWGGVWVTIYADAGDPKGPNGEMEADNVPADGSVILYRRFEPFANLIVVPTAPVCTDPTGVCCTNTTTCVDGTDGVTEEACPLNSYFGDSRLGLTCADIDPITAGAQPADCDPPNVVPGFNDRDTYQVLIPAEILINKNIKYWLAVQPQMNFAGNGQTAWGLSVNNTDHKAQQRFPAAGINDWQEIAGNQAAAGCQPTPPAGAATDLTFQLTGEKLPGGAPPNNACAAALSAADGITPFELLNSTLDGGSSCGNGVRDVWYVYTAPSAGTLTVSTCGTPCDTILSLHTGCVGNAGNQIACNDDDPGCAANPLNSTVSAAVPAGPVVIRVAGKAAADSCKGILTISFEEGPAVCDLVSWTSCGNHGGAGMLCKVANSDCDVEGRSCAGLFSIDMTCPTVGATASANCGGGPIACTVTNGDPLIVDCSPLPNGTCTVTLGGGASGSLQIRVLNGDVDKNGNVNAADITAIKPNLGLPVTPARANFDVDCNGSINAADITYVKPRLGGVGTPCP